MPRVLLKILSVALVALCVASAATAAQQPREPPLITVTGEAEVRVVPDEVAFDLTVETQNRDLKVAKTQTDERLKGVIELLRKYKVAPEDMQTDYIKLEPRYRRAGEARTFLGYSVRKDLVFTLRDVAQAEQLLSEVMTSGVTGINSINFRSSQLRKHRDQARALAIKAAQEKAIALSGEIGQKIGKAYYIEEEGPGSVTNFRTGAFNANNNIVIDGAESSGPSEGTLALGQIKVSARVVVRFFLE